MDILHEYLCTFGAVSHLILLVMRNVSSKTVKKIRTNFIFNNTSPAIVPFMR